MLFVSAMPQIAAFFAVFGLTLAGRVTVTTHVTTQVDSLAKARENHRKAHEDATLAARKPMTNEFDNLVKSTSADLGRLSQIDQSATKAGASIDTTSALSLVQVTLANFKRRAQKVHDTNSERKKMLEGSWSDLKKQREEWRKAVSAGAVAETYELAESHLMQKKKFAERIHTSLIQVSNEAIDKLKNFKAALTTAVATQKPIVTGKKQKEPSPEILLQAKDVSTWARRANGSLKAAQGYRP